MKYTQLFLFLLFPFIFTLFSLYQKETVYGDGIFYYSWLRSIVVDHDSNFANEYAHFGVNQLPTKTGLTGNQFAIGPAIYWSPAFLITHILFRGDGYSFPYQYAVGVLNVGYGIVGLLLFYRLLQQKIPTSAFITTLALGGATNVLFYIAFDTVTSHAISFLTSTILLTLLLEEKKRWFWIGLTCGLLGMIRIQDAAFIMMPVAFLSFRLIRNLKKVFLLFSGFVIPVLFQFLIWFLLYGDFRIPYIERGYGFNFLEPQLFQVLFSTNNGLFLWTPVIALALMGTLWTLLKKHSTIPPSIHMLSLLYFLWQTYLIGSWSIWWQGASFSGRMFISITPFLFLGIAELHYRFPKVITPLLLTSCFLNLILIGYYFLGYQR